MEIKLKRAYELPEKTDGYRVLVDRLWPRGVSKKIAKINLWDKNITPSTNLRRWFGHDPERWPQFREDYLGELENNPRGVADFLRQISPHQVVTLVYAAKDKAHTHALVLKDFLEERLNRS